MPSVVHITTVHNRFDNRIFHRECATLADAGYKVTLIVPGAFNKKVKGVQIRGFSCPNNRAARMTFGVLRAFRLALMEQAQVFHFHDPELIPIGLLLRALRKHVIYDVHEDNSTALLEREYIPRLIRSALARMLGKLEQLATRPFIHVLAEKYYSERFPHGCKILNYVQLPIEQAISFTDRPQLGPARLLYTGNIKLYRGAKEHVKILENVPEAELFLIGRCDNSLAVALQQQSGSHNDRLHIEGIDEYVPHERIIEYYERERWLAGLAIFRPNQHTDRKELTKIFEYMYYGIPIICSDLHSLRNIVSKHECGLCIDPESPLAIADAVRYLIENPNEASRMAANGQNAALTNYNWGTQATKLLSLYKRLTY